MSAHFRGSRDTGIFFMSDGWLRTREVYLNLELTEVVELVGDELDNAHESGDAPTPATRPRRRRAQNTEPVVAAAKPVDDAHEEYLSYDQLAARIPYTKQTLMNLVSRGVLRLGVHYAKPNGRGRPIFRWSAVQRWLEGQ